MSYRHVALPVQLLLLPTGVFLLGFSLFYAAGLDFAFASAIFDLQGGQWRLTNHWLFNDVLHRGGRLLNNVVLLVLLGFWLYQQLRARIGHSANVGSERLQALNKLMLSLLLSFAIVALIKRGLPTACPWDLQQFGGAQPFVGIFAKRPASLPFTQCFPAGHASVGYAWVALYFYFLPISKRKARLGLLTGLLLGLLFGIAQQLRGAHFISHDLTTLWLCWLTSAAVYLGYPNQLQSAARAIRGPHYV